jgi:hypothetical protein
LTAIQHAEPPLCRRGLIRKGPKRVLRLAIDQPYIRHRPTGIDSQLYGEHFVKVGTRHGLHVDIWNVSNRVARLSANLEPILEFGIVPKGVGQED